MNGMLGFLKSARTWPVYRSDEAVGQLPQPQPPTYWTRTDTLALSAAALRGSGLLVARALLRADLFADTQNGQTHTTARPFDHAFDGTAFDGRHAFSVSLCIPPYIGHKDGHTPACCA